MQESRRKGGIRGGGGQRGHRGSAHAIDHTVLPAQYLPASWLGRAQQPRNVLCSSWFFRQTAKMFSANWTGQQRAKQLPEHSQGVPKTAKAATPIPPSRQSPAAASHGMSQCPNCSPALSVSHRQCWKSRIKLNRQIQLSPSTKFPCGKLQVLSFYYIGWTPSALF